MNLNGLRVLNTRPLEQGLALTKAINKANGVSIELPALTILPTSDNWLDDFLNYQQTIIERDKKLQLHNIHQAIFISANAVNYFYQKLKEHSLSWPSTIKITAIGKASAEALLKWNIEVDNLPKIANSLNLLKLSNLQQITNQNILLIKGEDGLDVIASNLIKRGANLISLAVYKRVTPKISLQQIQSIWHDDKVDIIIFTSQQAMQNIFKLFDAKGKDWLINKPCLVISERLADFAKKLGVKRVIVSPYDMILNTLEQYVGQNKG